MTLNCPSCRLEVRVDASRLAPGRAHQAACPRCQHVFPVTVPPAAAERPQAPAATAPHGTGDPASEAWLRHELERLRRELKEEVVRDVLREVLADPWSPRGAASARTGAPRSQARDAMVVADDGPLRQAISAAVAAMGYSVEVASDLRTAATLLARGRHAVAVVERTLAGDEQAGAKVLSAINGLPGARRRELFVAYVSSDAATLDPGLAFATGSNMTVNAADAPRFGELLREGLAERDEMYRAFREVGDGETQ